MISDPVTLTDADVMDALAQLGTRPSSGPLVGISPSPADGRAVASGAEMSDEASGMLEIVAAPSRVVRAATVTRAVDGVGTTTFATGPGEGPFVAVARSDGGWVMSSVGSAGEVAVIVATHLGLAVPAESGGADTLDAGAWALLGALADNPAATSVAELEGSLIESAGPVVELFRMIGPVGVGFPDDPIVAAQRLAIAGVVVERSGAISLTEQGAGVVRSLASFALGGSLTVDHIDGSHTRRVAMLSFVRSPHRLFMGVWGLEDGLPVVALGEPGATEAIFTVRSLIAAIPVTSAPAG